MLNAVGRRDYGKKSNLKAAHLTADLTLAVKVTIIPRLLIIRLSLKLKPSRPVCYVRIAKGYDTNYRVLPLNRDPLGNTAG
jgi:hypothetical protein